jgi:hypothetical protein
MSGGASPVRVDCRSISGRGSAVPPVQRGLDRREGPESQDAVARTCLCFRIPKRFGDGPATMQIFVLFDACHSCADLRRVVTVDRYSAPDTRHEPARRGARRWPSGPALSGCRAPRAGDRCIRMSAGSPQGLGPPVRCGRHPVSRSQVPTGHGTVRPGAPASSRGPAARWSPATALAGRRMPSTRSPRCRAGSPRAGRAQAAPS